MKWLGRGKGVVIGLDGDTFHVIHDYRNTAGGITGTHHSQTTNAREAVISYADAVSQRITQNILDDLAGQGYNRYTGLKETELPFVRPKLRSIECRLGEDGAVEAPSMEEYKALIGR